MLNFSFRLFEAALWTRWGREVDPWLAMETWVNTIVLVVELVAEWFPSIVLLAVSVLHEPTKTIGPFHLNLKLYKCSNN